jgi:precorrin-2 dehydrogenase/sirohydrochlorin ferrochelatase
MRRGDLTIAVSTNGRSPGLARRIRRHIEELFGAEWGARIAEIGVLRQHWRAAGAGMREVARRTEDWVDRHGWLAAGGRPGAENRDRRPYTNPVH